METKFILPSGTSVELTPFNGYTFDMMASDSKDPNILKKVLARHIVSLDSVAIEKSDQLDLMYEGDFLHCLVLLRVISIGPEYNMVYKCECGQEMNLLINLTNVLDQSKTLEELNSETDMNIECKKVVINRVGYLIKLLKLSDQNKIAIENKNTRNKMSVTIGIMGCLKGIFDPDNIILESTPIGEQIQPSPVNPSYIQGLDYKTHLQLQDEISNFKLGPDMLAEDICTCNKEFRISIMGANFFKP